MIGARPHLAHDLGGQRLVATGRRWPPLDGVRGVAVLAVILFHARLPSAARGFSGVDVFFVLSGFLITMLLLDEHRRDGHIGYGRFYVRRLLRLYPALAACLVGCLLVAVVVHTRIAAVAGGAVAAFAYVSNLWIYSGHDTVLLQHTWTLALEEQFYLVWPPLLGFLLARQARPQWVAACAIAIVVGYGGLVAATHGSGAGILGSYLRTSGLPIGCLVALAVHHGLVPTAPVTDRAVRGLCVAAAGAWALATLGTGQLIPAAWFTGSVSVASIAAAVVVYGLVTGSPSRLGTLLQTRGLVWLGRRSYGLYLWHFPVLSLLIFHSPRAVTVWERTLLGMVVAAAAAELSFRYIETPFLRLKSRLSVGRDRPGVAECSGAV